MKQYHKNPRTISDGDLADLRRWLGELGDLSGVVHDLNSDEIIGGNQRGRVFDINECEIELVAGPHEADGQGTVAHGFVVWQGSRYAYRQVRWTARQCEKANIVANQAGGDWDGVILAAEHEAADLVEWGFEKGELEELLQAVGVAGGQNGDVEDEPLEDDEDLPLPLGIPDSLWPTDNEWGVPLLDIERQADAFDLPIETWGAKGRSRSAGTYHFYTEDARFNGLWSRPDMLVRAGCINAVEPNFSVFDQVPRAVALWATFKKRWLGRYWQSQGIRLFVDLNVARPYDDINLMGVPRGWLAYATRGYGGRLEMTGEELEIARTHAGTASVLFMVYGGGAAVRAWCEANGAVWVAEDMDRAKGRYLDALGS